MKVQAFLIRYKDDIPDHIKSYYNYEKWQSNFFKKTKEYHKTVKLSYFEQTIKLIEESNYDNYYPDLVNFAHLGIFDKNDEIEFCKLINILTINLEKVNSGDEMDKLIGFLRGYMDFIVHQYYQEKDLFISIAKLKIKIIEVNKNFPNESTDQVLRFIDLIL